MNSSSSTTKNIDFSGLRVGAFESRMQAEMIRLIQNLNGIPFVAPSMREVPLNENKEVFSFWEEVKRGQIDLLILMTGVGTRTLIKALSTRVPTPEVVAALEKLLLVVRGPKPVKALAEVGLAPHIRVPEPNTWRDVLKTLDEKKDLSNLTVAVQEYGEPNRLFLAELSARGAQVRSVSVYKSQLPTDTKPLSDLVLKIVQGEMDVLLFTNATQVENAMAMARKLGKAQEFRKAFERLAVASVGPSCSDMLRAYGLAVDMEPERPMMGALVAKAAEASQSVLENKKRVPLNIHFPKTGASKKGDALFDSRFMKACRKEKTDRTPIWLMRQAGRYMKEYRELRAKVSFLELCKNSDLAAEVTVDAAHRLGVDAAIIFSDLLPIVEPMGFELSYGKDQGPQISNPFKTAEDLKRVSAVDVEDSMAYVLQAIRKTRHALKSDLPLIGFAGAPFTLASYLIEGKGSKNFIETKSLMLKDPQTWHSLLEKITTVTIQYLNAQVAAGVQAVQIFDSWVGCLSPEDFRTYALPHTRRLVKSITPGVPVITFGTQTGGMLSLIKEAGGDVVGLDWRVELDEAWNVLGDVAVMGNLDPAVLFSHPKEIRERAQRLLNQAAGRPGHIFNLGHGILPGTPIENVFALIEAVKNHA
ncbi:MAG: Uroporphyrinogen decarboxylase [Elusimicrobia bacterium]|nr:Uroporphyrinogen decarboxylase [Elusimicrobiota bacterium]